MTTRAAIVLTWDSKNVRVRCPYSCEIGVHRHGFTDPHEPNLRMPHCSPRTDQNGDRVFPRDYRLLFPFEKDPVTENMWWELDYQKKRWRTVGWTVYDPEYLEACDDADALVEVDARNDSRGRKSEDDVRDVANALSSLSVNDSDTRAGNAERVSSESPTSSQDTLYRNSILAGPVVDTTRLDCQTMDLLAFIEDKHQVAELLLEHGISLASRDDDGNTALLKALHFGRGTLAQRLVETGADINARNDENETVHIVAQASLELQKEAVRSRNLLLHPQEPPLIHLDLDHTALQRNIDVRRSEIHGLEQVIASYEQEQRMVQRLDRLRRIGVMFGQEQADAFEACDRLDERALLIRLLSRVMSMPRGTIWKTVACLTRGTVLPWTFAVSGYSASETDGALHRPTWIGRVFQLAKLIGYHLQADDRREEQRRDGSYLACHSEKQLLAYFIWNHTSGFCSVDDTTLPSLRCSEPSRDDLSRLHPEIYVAQPGRENASICDDCKNFCKRVVDHFGFHLTLCGVINNEIAWTREILPS